jgi:hypothetical protein
MVFNSLMASKNNRLIDVDTDVNKESLDSRNLISYIQSIDKNISQIVENTKDSGDEDNKDTSAIDKIKSWFSSLISKFKTPPAVATPSPPSSSASTVTETTPTLAGGGSTTAHTFITGEGKGGKPGPDAELIKNPTGAPIEVYNRDQLNSMGVNMDNINSSFNDNIPRFAFGTASETGQTVASGGSQTSGTQIASEAISGVTSVTQTLANLIPGIGPIIGLVVQGLGQLAQAAVGLVDGFNKLSEEIKIFSGDVLAATVNYDIKKIMQDVEIGEKHGKDIAQIYEVSGDAWLEVREKLIDTAVQMKDYLIPSIIAVKDIAIDTLKCINFIVKLLEAISDKLGVGKEEIIKLLKSAPTTVLQDIGRHLESIDNKTPDGNAVEKRFWGDFEKLSKQALVQGNNF